MDAKKLQSILKKHLKWLRGEKCGERADLSGADLSGADLRWAALRWADLSGAKEIPFIPMACPDSGSFIGWKKAVVRDEAGFKKKEVIVKLRICDDAKRSSSTGRKCRCDKAEVLELQTLDGAGQVTEKVASSRDKEFVYAPNTIVSVSNFNENRWEECAAGIHFFTNRQEAVDYFV